MYGLSYDLYLMQFATYFISLYCTVIYKYSELAARQFSDRFPLYYSLNAEPIPISMPILLIDLVMLAVSSIVIFQLWKYRATRNVKQGTSLLLICIFLMILIFSYFTYICAEYNLPERNSGRFGVYYIEHVNYLWVIGQFLSAVKYLPQISLNWMGISTKGLSPKYLKISIIATSILQASNLCSFIDNLEFYEWPFNLTPRVVSFLQLIWLGIIYYQHYYAYAMNKPYLKRIYE